MIVHPPLYMVGMEVGNQSNHSKEEDSEVGNIIARHNGSKNALLVQWIEHFTTDEEIRVQIFERAHLIR